MNVGGRCGGCPQHDVIRRKGLSGRRVRQRYPQRADDKDKESKPAKGDRDVHHEGISSDRKGTTPQTWSGMVWGF